MPVAFDAAGSASSSAASYSYTHTPVGTPSGVVVAVGVRENLTRVSTVTYGGQAMTLVKAAVNAALNRIEMFYLNSPPSGAQTVAVTLVGAQESVAMSCTVTGSGANQPYGTTSCAGLTAAAACNVVGCDANGLVVGVIHVERSNTDAQITPAAAQTQRVSVSGPTLDRPRCEMTTQASTAGNVTSSWTLTTADDWLVASICLSDTDAGFGASLAGVAGTVNMPWNE